MGALPVLDEHGYAALCCAADGSALAPAADGSSVLVCAECGHRTDQPGAGVLGDGFDVQHRQWGLRGDPHAWSALRDLLKSTPTPATAEEVRAAYVDGLTQVVGVDIDTSDERQVGVGELDHGGMSGGMVDLDWWRTKGIPLLVDRAVDRRPATADAPGDDAGDGDEGVSSTRSRIGGVAMTIVVWAVLLGITAALVGGGGWLLYQRAYGTRAEATVLDCQSSGNFRRYGSDFRTECIAEWTIDGETVVGNYEVGDGQGDVGKTVEVTVRGDTAYSRSLGLPILLLVLGLPFLVLIVFAVRRGIRDRLARTPAASSS